ncbi:hypothetical protein EI94DRAFT_1789662 [Lactarius quietus]|nr:hypothetical protein EI94DRAFT_1789662 [Lactarius quietus]
MPYVWCLLIDKEHKPSFGEPFSVYKSDASCTIHDVKASLKSGDNKNDFRYCSANRIEIWRCNAVKLSSKDPLTRLKELLTHVNFPDDSEDSSEERPGASHVQHLGAGQTLGEIGLEDDEVLLVLVP